MKRILVLSDTHRKVSLALRVIPAIKPDAIIHLGDMVSDAEEIEAYFPDIPLSIHEVLCRLPQQSHDRSVCCGTRHIFRR